MSTKTLRNHYEINPLFPKVEKTCAQKDGLSNYKIATLLKKKDE